IPAGPVALNAVFHDLDDPSDRRVGDGPQVTEVRRRDFIHALERDVGFAASTVPAGIQEFAYVRAPGGFRHRSIPRATRHRVSAWPVRLVATRTLEGMLTSSPIIATSMVASPGTL